MKDKKLFYMLWLCLCMSVAMMSCTKEERIEPTKDLQFKPLFEPQADAHAKEKYLFQKYNVWIRMDFTDPTDVYNAYLGQDVTSARFPAQKIDDDKRESAYNYMDTLLSNLPYQFVQDFIPNEFFFVKTYGFSAFGVQFNAVSRNRLAFVWPNTYNTALSTVHPTNHYYRDSTLTREVWRNLADMIGSRGIEEIEGFESIGKPYDGGTAFNKIRDQYFIDRDLEKRNRDWQTLADQGGYLDPYASVSFKAEHTAFMKLILLESYDRINRQYLQGNEMRRKKYDLFIKYYKDKYGWDMQESGNKFRQRINQNNT